MDRETGLVHALSALVEDDVDVQDVLLHLVLDAAEVLGAAAVAVLAQDGDSLTPLATTSHRASELEMLQVQRSTGPCIEAIADGAMVRCVGSQELVARWPEVGPTIVSAGFSAVESFPVSWLGRPVAGLNLFFRQNPDPALQPVKQAYADMVALAVAGTAVPEEGMRTQLGAVFASREVVEQAKGVIAVREGVSMDVAFDRLVALSQERSTSVTRVAADVVATRTSLADPG